MDTATSCKGKRVGEKMKHFMESSQKDTLIKEISSYLDLQRENIAAAYLFGSFVTEGSFSDIDLAILTQTEIARPLDFELNLENELEKVAEFPVDVRILNCAPLSFCHNVIRYGRVVLDRDPTLRSDFEGKVLKQYFDFSRFRRQYLAEVTNAPV
jgi:hypothetical protein